MIVQIVDIHGEHYEIETEQTNIKSVVTSIFKGDPFVETTKNIGFEKLTVFLAVNQIATIRELSQKEIRDREHFEF